MPAIDPARADCRDCGLPLRVPEDAANGMGCLRNRSAVGSARFRTGVPMPDGRGFALCPFGVGGVRKAFEIAGFRTREIPPDAGASGNEQK